MDNFPAGVVLGISTSLAFGFLIYIGWLYSPFWGRTHWRRVGTLREIVFYPLKSGAGVALSKAVCDTFGLRTIASNESRIQDRCFVAFDFQRDSIVTNREFPKLVLVKWKESGDNYVTFEAPEENSIRLLKPTCVKENRKLCSLWNGDTIYVMDFGESAAQWISKYLGVEDEKGRVHLGYFCPEFCLGRSYGSHLLHMRSDFPNMSKRDCGIYSDFTPYTLISESSIKALKEKLGSEGNQIGPDWFRPNFVVTGSEEFEEDTWNYVKIGNSVFQNVIPCHRDLSCCIDPNTGLKSPKGEPFRTLLKYRRMQSTTLHQRPLIAMGVGLGLRMPGSVRCGDEVFVADQVNFLNG